jgi:hypothetical protein
MARKTQPFPECAQSHVVHGNQRIPDQVRAYRRNPEWVKRNLKKTYLGCEEVTYTDFITGEKTTTWEPRHTADLDTAKCMISS